MGEAFVRGAASLHPAACTLMTHYCKHLCRKMQVEHGPGEEQFELWFEDLMGRLVREAKIGLVNWQLSAGGPEMATVAKACRKLHLDHLASLWGVPFETQQFAAWSRGKLVES